MRVAPSYSASRTPPRWPRLEALQQKGAASPAEIDAARARVQLDDSTLHGIEQHSTERYGQADRARAPGAACRCARQPSPRPCALVPSEDIHTPIAGTSTIFRSPSTTTLASTTTPGRRRRPQTSGASRPYFDEPEIGNLAADSRSPSHGSEVRHHLHGHITQAPPASSPTPRATSASA